MQTAISRNDSLTNTHDNYHMPLGFRPLRHNNCLPKLKAWEHTVCLYTVTCNTLLSDTAIVYNVYTSMMFVVIHIGGKVIGDVEWSVEETTYSLWYSNGCWLSVHIQSCMAKCLPQPPLPVYFILILLALLKLFSSFILTLIVAIITRTIWIAWSIA